MSKDGKYIARLSQNPYRTSMMSEIELLKKELLLRGTEVAISSGIIFDLGLAACIAELRRLINTSEFLNRTKEVKIEKEAAKIIQDYQQPTDKSEVC